MAGKGKGKGQPKSSSSGKSELTEPLRGDEEEQLEDVPTATNLDPAGASAPPMVSNRMTDEPSEARGSSAMAALAATSRVTIQQLPSLLEGVTGGGI
mmetsp:Transcript_41438/g.64697  ORF Transcript_41438/g.64697 Transcript_41438/m.64697 type:complete len:97 (-) Transcript_41438:10-300(-)